MNGKFKIIVPKPHGCIPPKPSHWSNIYFGSVWQCECGQFFLLKNHPEGYGPCWRRISKRSAERRIRKWASKTEA